MADNNNYNDTPSQFRIFKKKSALRIQLAKPVRADQKYEVGCLYMQVAPAVNDNGLENGYAWEERKISVKLGFNDITSVLSGLKADREVNLYHTSSQGKKTINFSPKDGGGYFVTVEHTPENGDKNRVSVPLSDEEVDSLVTMMHFALPLIHNWL